MKFDKRTLILLGTGPIFAFPTGYNNQLTNTVQPLIYEWVQEHLGSGPKDEQLVTIVMSSIIAGAAIGSIFGSMLASVLGRWMGPLGVLSFVGGPLLVMSGVTMGLSFFVGNVWLFLFGRLLNGVGIGISFVHIGVYVSECAPAAQRGFYNIFCRTTASVGTLVGSVLGLRWVFGTMDHIYLLFGLSALNGIAAITVGFFWPESPGWWVAKGDEAKARGCLEMLMGNDANEREIRRIIKGMQTRTASKSKEATTYPRVTYKQMLTTRKYRRPFIMGWLINCSTVLCGQATLSYTTYIYMSYNTIPMETAQMLTLMTNVAKMFGYAAAIPLVQISQRRPLFLSGCFIITLIMTLLPCVPYIDDPRVKTAIFTMIWLTYVTVKDATVASLRTLLPVEITQTEIRIQASGIAICFTRITMSASMFAFYPLFLHIGSYTFLLYAAATLCMTVYVGLGLPETHNKSFREISKHWEEYNPEDPTPTELTSLLTPRNSLNQELAFKSLDLKREQGTRNGSRTLGCAQNPQE